MAHALEIPAQLLAGFQQGDVLALVLHRQLDLPHGGVPPLTQRRQGRDGSALQRGLRLLEQPRIAEAAPPDHGHVRAGELQDAHRVLRGEDVAVGDDRHGHRLLHLPDGDPVRLPAVHLGTGAAVDGDGADARLLQHFCQLHRVDAALVPAPAHFYRHGHGAGLDHGLGQARRLLRVAHQGGAVAVGHHLSHGAAHVDVDDVRAGHLRRDDGGLGHAGDIAAEDLGGGGTLVGRQLQQTAALFILIAQRLGADQLRAAHTGAQLAAYLAEGHVGDAGHRRQIQLGVDLYVSDVHERLLCVYCVSAGYFTTKNFC